MGFNYLKATEPLQGDSFLFTNKSLGSFGTHLMNLSGMKDWVNFGAWIQDPWIGNPET